MADFNIDLASFEKDLAAGVYDKLLASLKGKKEKTRPKLSERERAKLKAQKEKAKQNQILAQVPVKPVELPAPIAVVYYYKQFCCSTCNQASILLAQRLVRFELGKQTYLKPETEIADNVDSLLKGGIKIQKMVSKEQVIVCSYCVDNSLFNNLEETSFTTQRGR